MLRLLVGVFLEVVAFHFKVSSCVGQNVFSFRVRVI